MHRSEGVVEARSGEASFENLSDPIGQVIEQSRKRAARRTDPRTLDQDEKSVGVLFGFETPARFAISSTDAGSKPRSANNMRPTSSSC